LIGREVIFLLKLLQRWGVKQPKAFVGSAAGNDEERKLEAEEGNGSG
jgi:hypothetical protein